MTADLAQAADAAFMEHSANPGAFIVKACEQARDGLCEALEAGDIDRVAAIWRQAERVRAGATLELAGRAAWLAAEELVRRGERAIGLAIARGQEDGTIRGPHEGKLRFKPGSTKPLRSAREFATSQEMGGGQAVQPGIRDMAEGVTDEDFEAAVAEARAEGNLSRRNVGRKLGARKAEAPAGDGWIPRGADRAPEAGAQRRKLIRAWAAQGYTSRQMAGLLGMNGDGVRRLARLEGIDIPADKTVAGTRRHDSTRIARETVQALEALAMGTELVAVGDVAPAEAKDWAASLTESLRVLNRFARQIKEIKPSE